MLSWFRETSKQHLLHVKQTACFIRREKEMAERKVESSTLTETAPPPPCSSHVTESSAQKLQLPLHCALVFDEKQHTDYKECWTELITGKIFSVVCQDLYVGPQGAAATVVLRLQIQSSSNGQYLKISLQAYC